jgi:hypothetical protein
MYPPQYVRGHGYNKRGEVVVDDKRLKIDD